MNSLNELAIGEIARIKKLNCTGDIRRRMLDLGLVEGTLIRALFKSPCGDPTAFEIRNSVIALRKEDSRNILII